MDLFLRKQNIEQYLSCKLQPINVNGQIFFHTPTGSVVVVDMIASENALVLGHADNLDEAELNRFEDGDRFFMDEMTEAEMLQAMLLEIAG